jgi:hypothetical protein
MQDSGHLKELEDIMNNPLCTVTGSFTQVIKEVQHDPDSGRPMMTIERIMRIMEWDEKALL